MISTSQADDLILNSTSISQEEIIDIESSIGRTLFKEISSVRNQPPFHRVMMDGIALDSKVKSTEYKIENIQAAGRSQLTLKNSNNCIEVMTGAPLPVGCDCVIPYENIKISKESNFASINIEDIIELNNIHLEATDYKAGDILLSKGIVITSPVVAIIASQGTREVSVFKRPKIAVISTGDELVELNSEVLPHQIYMSNSYAIMTELEKFGIESLKRIHIIDDKDSTETKIKELLNENDILIITGGVSMGKFDFIPEVLSKLGVEQVFHKIKQKPGKPMWYGIKDHKQIFALPGNPVSCLVCLRRFVIPSLIKSAGYASHSIYGQLTEVVEFNKDFTLFKPVMASYSKSGQLLLTPVESNNSGDFYSLGSSDGFVELPDEKKVFNKAESYKYYPWQK